MKAYTMTAAALTENGNQLKEVFLSAMVTEGKLTQEQADDMNDYCLIVSEKGFFGRFWDKILWKKGDDNMKINVVKVVKDIK